MATELRLPDGTRAVTWSLLPDDREELAHGYELLDEQSKYDRFLAVVPHLNERLLHHLVDEVDGVDHVALVLFVLDGDDVGRPAGVARIIRYPDDPGTADVAVTVLPAYRGRGVASALLDRLLAERPVGVQRILTEVAAENVASLRMLQRLGPTHVEPEGDGSVLRVEVTLP